MSFKLLQLKKFSDTIFLKESKSLYLSVYLLISTGATGINPCDFLSAVLGSDNKYGSAKLPLMEGLIITGAVKLTTFIKSSRNLALSSTCSLSL
jgi:hypothetical protein